jgi:hypothetical protein
VAKCTGSGLTSTGESGLELTRPIQKLITYALESRITPWIEDVVLAYMLPLLNVPAASYHALHGRKGGTPTAATSGVGCSCFSPSAKSSSGPVFTTPYHSTAQGLQTKSVDTTSSSLSPEADAIIHILKGIHQRIDTSDDGWRSPARLFSPFIGSALPLDETSPSTLVRQFCNDMMVPFLSGNGFLHPSVLAPAVNVLVETFASVLFSSLTASPVTTNRVWTGIPSKAPSGAGSAESTARVAAYAREQVATDLKYLRNWLAAGCPLLKPFALHTPPMTPQADASAMKPAHRQVATALTPQPAKMHEQRPSECPSSSLHIWAAAACCAPPNPHADLLVTASSALAFTEGWVPRREVVILLAPSIGIATACNKAFLFGHVALLAAHVGQLQATLARKPVTAARHKKASVVPFESTAAAAAAEISALQRLAAPLLDTVQALTDPHDRHVLDAIATASPLFNIDSKGKVLEGITQPINTPSKAQVHTIHVGMASPVRGQSADTFHDGSSSSGGISFPYVSAFECSLLTQVLT